MKAPYSFAKEGFGSEKVPILTMAGVVQTCRFLIIGAVLLWVGGEQSVLTKAFQSESMTTFRPFQSPATGRHEHHHSYLRRFRKKKNEQKTTAVPGNTNTFTTNGGVGLMLLHRYEHGSPLRAVHATRKSPSSPEKKSAIAATVSDALQRDMARVRAVDAVVMGNLTSNSLSRRIESNAADGEALKSQVFSGLNLGSGEYFTSLSIGSPPTEVLLTIDTGSDLVWLQCHACKNCYDQLDPIFDPELSNTYAAEACISSACAVLPRSSCDDLNCQYSESYGDGSYSQGELATETFTVSSTSGEATEIPGIVFGCGHDNNGLFTASSGLLGLGRGRLSFPSQLSQYVEPRFSYCLVDRFLGTFDSVRSGEAKEVTSQARQTTAASLNGTANATNPERRAHDSDPGAAVPEKGDEGQDGDEDGTGTGTGTNGNEYGDGNKLTPSSYLFFGDSEAAGGFESDMTYTDLIRNPSSPSFYYLQLTGISVAAERVDFAPSVFELDASSGRGGVILDSGTAVTRLATPAYVAMRDSFRLKARNLKLVVLPEQQLFDTCFRLVPGQLVPVVTLHFATDADLVLPRDNVVIPVDDTGSVFCLAFAATELRAGLSIIGNVQQQGFRFEFDLEKERVGFTRKNCGIAM